MELKITGMEVEQKPIAFNYEELKAQITAKAELYKNMVYDEDQVKEAKADRATLNKFKTALEGKRRDVKKDCLKPYEDFENKVNNLIYIIDEPIKLIDTQVKKYEEQEKQKKYEEIQKIFVDVGFQTFVSFDDVFNEKWLLKSTSLKKIKDELEEIRNTIGHDVATIQALPEFSFEAMEEYKRTLNLGRAIQEGQRLSDIQKRKEEAEKREAEEKARREAEERTRLEEEKKLARIIESEEVLVEEDVEPVEVHEVRNGIEVNEEFEKAFELKQWLTFSAYVTLEQAGQLGEFCRANGIELKTI